jgi:hypothetical protein
MWKAWTIAVLCVLVVACSRDKGPAEEAIKQAVQAVEQVRGEASQFAAQQFQELEAKLRAVQDSFAKKEYSAALQAAQGVVSSATEVGQAAATAKADLTKAWEDMSAGMPQLMEAVKSRLDILAEAKKLPEGLDQNRLASLRTSYDEAVAQFEEAKNAAASGALAKAVELGSSVKTKAAEVATALGLQQQS